MIRHFGVEQLQQFIREDCKVTSELNQKISENPHFEIVFPPRFALITFRLRGSDELNKKFLDRLNSSGKLLMSQTLLKNQFVIRWSVSATLVNGTKQAVEESWEFVKLEAVKILQEQKS